MATVYIHVGHGKTGTTYLQNTLTKSAGVLAERGIDYFLPDGLRNSILRNDARINSGNGLQLFDDLEHPGASYGTRDRLYSNEHLFTRLLINPEGLTATANKLSDHFGEIKILFFIRNPIDYAIAQWQQGIKRHGHTDSLSAALKPQGYLPLLHEVLGRLAAEPRVQTTIHNYSRVTKDIVGCTEDWLGITRGTLAVPAAEKVNRSLTGDELVVQRFLNRIFGKKASYFSDKMCQKFPNRRVRKPEPTKSDLQDFRALNREALEQVNRLLPAHAQLQL